MFRISVNGERQGEYQRIAISFLRVGSALYQRTPPSFDPLGAPVPLNRWLYAIG